MPLKIIRNDITKMNCDAIVNTANSAVEIGAGCDRAIYMAAGIDLMLEARRKIGAMLPGEAALTPGFKLPAKYVIHAVSPMYKDGESGEEKLLRKCYKNSLELAKKNGFRSIAFPLISSGSFGYPREEAVLIAVDEIRRFLAKYDMEVYLTVFDSESTEVVRKRYPKLRSSIDNLYVHAMQEKEYGPEVFAKRVSRSEERQHRLFPDLGQKPSGRQSARRTAADGRADMPDMHAGMKLNAGAPKPLKDISPDLEMPEEVECCACEIEPVEFMEQNGDRLAERIAHKADGFQPYFFYLLKCKNLENAEVRRRAYIDKRLFSKIKNNEKYHPDKLTVLRLCVGAQLNLDETKDLLARAGYAMAPGDVADIIFQFFIENGIYDILEIDITFEEYGLTPIIA